MKKRPVSTDSGEAKGRLLDFAVAKENRRPYYVVTPQEQCTSDSSINKNYVESEETGFKTGIPPTPQREKNANLPARKRRHMGFEPRSFGLLTFRHAAIEWHTQKKRDFRKEKSRAWEIYSYYFGIAGYDPSFDPTEIRRRIGNTFKTDRRLAAFFGDIRLCDITMQEIEDYEDLRQAHASPTSVNREINALLQVMEVAGLRAEIERHYRPLPTPPPRIPRILTPEEEEDIFMVASSNHKWELAYWVLSLANNTAAGPQEIRLLQWRHVDMVKRTIHIPDEAAKNEFRARPVPLNDRAYIQMDRILTRARSLGSFKPDHYVFPFKVVRNRYDATRPASPSFIKVQLYALRKAVNKPNLTAYWFRHTAITKLYEDPENSEETVRHIAGHHSKKIKEVYSHSRNHRMRSALDRLSPRHRAEYLEEQYRSGKIQPQRDVSTRKARRNAESY